MARCPSLPLPLLSLRKTVWTDCDFSRTLPGSDVPAPLASSVLEHAVDLPAPPGFDGNQKKEEVPSPTVSASSSNRARDTGGDVKIPKWLKLGPSESLSMRRPPVYLVVTFLFQRSKRLTPGCYSSVPFTPLSRNRVVVLGCCIHCRNTVTLDIPD